MNYTIRRVLSITLLVLSSPLLPTHDEHSWQSTIGLNFNYARYTFGCLPQFAGYLAGLHWDLSHSWPCNWYTNIQFDGNWNAGPICNFCDNDCNNNNECNNGCTTPTGLGCPDIKARIRDFRPELDFGYNFTFCENENVVFTPFIGVGFMYLSNTLIPQDVKYRYFNVNVPIGFNLLWIMQDECDRRFDVGLSFTYRIDAWTRLKFGVCNIDMSTITCNEVAECNNNDCNRNCQNPASITVTCTPSETTCQNECDNGCKIHLNRTQGLRLSVPLTWHRDMREDRCVEWQTRVVPFFDWNRFGCSDEVNENNIAVPIPQLKQWYLGLHVDTGINW